MKGPKFIYMGCLSLFGLASGLLPNMDISYASSKLNKQTEIESVLLSNRQQSKIYNIMPYENERNLEYFLKHLENRLKGRYSVEESEQKKLYGLIGKVTDFNLKYESNCFINNVFSEYQQLFYKTYKLTNEQTKRIFYLYDILNLMIDQKTNSPILI